MNTESFKTKVISNGRIAIPKDIREYLSIDLGDWVEVHIKKVKNRDGTTGNK